MTDFPVGDDDFNIPDESPPMPVATAVADPEPASEPREGLTEEQVLEVLEPRRNAVVRTIGKGPKPMQFTQQPLSFMTKWDFFKLLGKAFADLQDVEKGLTWDKIIAAILPEDDDRPDEELTDEENVKRQLDAFMRVDTIFKLASRLAAVAPDLLDDMFCIWLNVPVQSREVVKEVMRAPVEDGGLDDETGFDIIELGLEQNAEDVIRFFTERAPKLLEKAAALSRYVAQKRSSKLSKLTPPSTESA